LAKEPPQEKTWGKIGCKSNSHDREKDGMPRPGKTDVLLFEEERQQQPVFAERKE